MVGTEAHPGIIQNSFKHIFQDINNRNDGMKFLVRCSYLELVNEEIHDLLIDNKQTSYHKLDL